MQYPKSRTTERKGINYVADIVNDMGFIWREIPTADIGIDGYIELIENENSSGVIIAVQVKSGKSYIHKEKEDHFFFYTDKDHLIYWDMFEIPVLLIIYSPIDKTAYWLDLKEYFTLNPISERGSYYIYFQKKVFDINSKNEILDMGKNYWKEIKKTIFYSGDKNKEFWEKYTKGRSLWDSGNYDNSLKIFNNLLKKYPNHYWALRGVGMSLCKLKKYEEAHKYYYDAINRNFKVNTNKIPFKRFWFCSGLCKLFFEECCGNLDFLKTLAENNPNDFIIQANFGLSLIYIEGKLLPTDNEKIQEAEKIFNKLTQQNPNDDDFWYIKGRFFWDLESYNEALICYNKILELNPEHEYIDILEDIKKHLNHSK